MMEKQSEQIQMVILDVGSMIPEAHLLRRIKKDLLANSLEYSCAYTGQMMDFNPDCSHSSRERLGARLSAIINLQV